MNLMSLTSWKVKERAIHQPTQHAMNLMSLTTWKVQEKGNLSAHTACNESDITYFLEGEGEENLSAYTACNESDVSYFLEGEEEGNLSAHAACNENITYSLEDEGGGQFISLCSMQ